VKKELAISGFWLFLSLYLGIESYRLGLSTGNRPGPGFFPFGAAAAIGVITGFHFVKNFRQGSSIEVSEPGDTGEAPLVLAVLAGMLAYVLLLDVLGFLLCNFLLLAFYLKVIAARSWRVSTSFAAAAALVSHLFFDVLLNAQLPRGLLGWFH
jgi:hypothetical protein